MRKANFIFLIVILLLGVCIWVMTGKFAHIGGEGGFGPAFYIKFLLIFLLVLIAIQFYRTIKEKEEQGNFELKTLKTPAITVGILVIYILLLNLIGFLIASLIFVFVCMRVFHAKLLSSIVVTVSVVFFTYGLFRYVFRVLLPVGTIFGG